MVRRWEATARQLGLLLFATASVTSACEADAKPMLWHVTKGNSSAYLLAGNHLEVEDVEPVADSVTQAISCADIAYFNVACTPGTDGGLGNFLEHCKNYPINDPKDSIAARLPAATVTQLQQALITASDSAPPDCSAAATKLRGTALELNSTDYRRTLRIVYKQATAVLDVTTCTVDATKAHADEAVGGGFEGYVREQFGAARPTFGLQDVTSQCELLQGTSQEQDAHLAAAMVRKLSNASWIAKYMRNRANLAEALKCGNLTELKEMPDVLHIGLLSESNQKLAQRIAAAMTKNEGRRLLVVLAVGHFLDFGYTKGVQSLMEQGGYTVTRMEGAGLNCAASQHYAKGAKELGMCLMPPDRSQPESCTNFLAEMEQKISNDTMQGRVKQDQDCKQCLVKAGSCQCSYAWRNASTFTKLCEDTVVNGTSGQVLQLDLTRNPGSSRTGAGQSEKTVYGSGQNCYARSCDLSLLEEMATRNWYKSDVDLNMGVARLNAVVSSAAVPAQVGSSLAGFFTIVSLILVVSLIGLAVWFFMPKSVARTRGVSFSPGNEELKFEPEPFDQVQQGFAPQPGFMPQKEQPMQAPFPRPQANARSLPASMPGYAGEQLPGQMAGLVSAQMSGQMPNAMLSQMPGQMGPPPAYDQMYDSSLLRQAMAARQQLENAGNEALMTMQSSGGSNLSPGGLQVPQTMPPMGSGLLVPQTVQPGPGSYSFSSLLPSYGGYGGYQAQQQHYQPLVTAPYGVSAEAVYYNQNGGAVAPVSSYQPYGMGH